MLAAFSRSAVARPVADVAFALTIAPFVSVLQFRLILPRFQKSSLQTLFAQTNLLRSAANLAMLAGFRSIATRYDKLASTFLAAIQLVSALFWLN